MLKIDITLNTREFTRHMTAVAQRQVPFATARALTETAIDAAKGMRQELKREFNIKAPRLLRQYNPFPNRGMTLRANKRDGIHRMKSTIGLPERSKSGKLLPDFALHATGGTKTPHRGRRLAIPTSALLASKTGRITPSKRPEALLRKKGHFIRKATSGQTYIFKRDRRAKWRPGPGGRGGTYPIIPLYLLVRRARIKRQFDFDGTVRRVANAKLRRNFVTAMNRALKTARPI